MSSKLILNRLLHLNHRSVCCKNFIVNRQLIGHHFPIARCLSHDSETKQNNEMVITERIKEFAEKAISSRQMRNKTNDMDVFDKELWNIIGDRKINALSESPDYELLNEISPTLPKSFNLAAFADKSETLQMLIKLGVDLYYIENRSQENAEYILKLDFGTEIKPYIHFLVDNGVSPEFLGFIITKNPKIFCQHLDDLEIRIRYLKSKKFTKEMITSIIIKAPKFLNFPTKRIDYQLAFLQKDFNLVADEVRQLVTSYPRLALLEKMNYQVMLFAFKEEFGFNSQEIKQMVLKYQRLFYNLATDRKSHRIIVQIFDLVHNEMKIPHKLIAKYPEILDWRIPHISGRHLYLKALGRDQYDPKQPLYVPLSAFTGIEDNEFCEKYAKTSVQDFNLFLKSL